MPVQLHILWIESTPAVVVGLDKVLEVNGL